MLDNPEGTESDAYNDDVLESKLRAEAERMTTENTERAARPPHQEEDDAPEQGDDLEPVENRQTTQEPQKYRVKVDSDELEVSLDELLNGYSRQADYTRKMQALSEDRKRQVEAPRTQYEQLNNQLISRLQAFMPEKPDVAMLNPQSEKYNPDHYHLQRANFEAFQEHLTVAQREQQRLDSERNTEARQSASQRLDEEGRRVLQAIPEWKDPKVLQEDVGKMQAFLHSNGLSDQDINAWVGSPTFNHIQVKILRLAIQAANATDKKALVDAKVKDVPPVTRPGAAEVKDTDSDEVRRLKAAVKKNPRDDRLVATLWAAQDKQTRNRANRR